MKQNLFGYKLAAFFVIVGALWIPISLAYMAT